MGVERDTLSLLSFQGVKTETDWPGGCGEGARMERNHSEVVRSGGRLWRHIWTGHPRRHLLQHLRLPRTHSARYSQGTEINVSIKIMCFNNKQRKSLFVSPHVLAK